jgi:hypothetical protein
VTKSAPKLGEYERKRDFGKTAEPAPPRRARRRKGAPRFVVQQHDATRLHWDLRLEHEGVGVSCPLEWDEVEAAVEAGDAAALVFTVDDLRRRVAAKGDLFAPLLSRQQELPAL